MTKEALRILAVEDDVVDYMTLERAFKNSELDVLLERADTVAKAKEIIKTSDFDCIILDYRLPDATGLDFLTSEEYAHVNKDVAVIMLTGESDVSVAVDALKNGAQDYIPKKAVCAELLELSIRKAREAVNLGRKLEEYQRQVEELAFFDPLTGLPNRYVFDDRLNQLISMAKRSKQTFMVGMMDLNSFKPINDSLGHLAGDKVLQAVALRLSAAIREGDTVARFGGDEFAMLLPENEGELHIEGFIKRISEAVSEPILIDGNEVRVGISIGISKYPSQGEDSTTLVKIADEELYKEKYELHGDLKSAAN